METLTSICSKLTKYIINPISIVLDVFVIPLLMLLLLIVVATIYVLTEFTYNYKAIEAYVRNLKMLWLSKTNFMLVVCVLGCILLAAGVHAFIRYRLYIDVISKRIKNRLVDAQITHLKNEGKVIAACTDRIEEISESEEDNNDSDEGENSDDNNDDGDDG